MTCIRWILQCYFRWFFISLLFFQIKALIFLQSTLGLCLCLYFVTMEMVSSFSNLIFVFVPLELINVSMGVLCSLCTVSIWVSKNQKFPSIVNVLLKKSYVCFIIVTSYCLLIFKHLFSGLDARVISYNVSLEFIGGVHQ